MTTIADIHALLTERRRRLEIDLLFLHAICIDRYPYEWVTGWLRVVQCDGAETLFLGPHPVSRHDIAFDGMYVFVRSTWLGGPTDREWSALVEATDKAEAQDLNDYCASLTAADSALYGRIRR